MNIQRRAGPQAAGELTRGQWLAADNVPIGTFHDGWAANGLNYPDRDIFLTLAPS